MELERRCNSFIKIKQKINDLISKLKEKPVHSVFNPQ